MQVEVEIDRNVFLPCYQHLVASQYDIDFLYGSRDSGKSHFIAQELIRDCLSADYFRCILIKKTYESVRDAQFQTIKDIIYMWGVQELFTFKESPLEIKCVNGNRFIARGCDKPEKLKSISNPSHAWYEEGNQLSEPDYITASTTLRRNNGRVKEWFSFNPEYEGELDKYWLYRMYFKGQPANCSFTAQKIQQLSNGGTVSLCYRATHTTYNDNPKCSGERIARYESLKEHDPFWYQVYGLGHWASRKARGAEFYPQFNRNIHVKKLHYNPALPVHLSFDFNVLPYMTMLCCQVAKENERTVFRFFKEYCLRNPDNSSAACAKYFMEDFALHRPVVFYYGDASGKNRIAGQGNKRNFDDIEAGLITLLNTHSDRVLTRNPQIFKARDFINRLLSGYWPSLGVEIDESCTRLIADMENVKVSIEGKAKEIISDKSTGTRYQQYGHTSDALTYLLVSALWNLYNATSEIN